MDPEDIITYLMQEEEEDDAEMSIVVVTYTDRLGNNYKARCHTGSVLNYRVIHRNRELGNQLIYRDYFSDNPTYPDYIFRRRFRIRKSLFLRIQRAIESHDSYFVQKYSATRVLGLSPLQKITAALRMIAYGLPTDAIDDYVRIDENTVIESLRKFVQAIIEIFGEQYLRKPNNSDVQRLMKVVEQRGFPGMLDSIDCMHWRWKNCPTAWHGAFSGRYHDPTIILEAITSHDLWIWHAYFGSPGSLTDINVLDRSNLFSEWTEGRALEVNYTINGHDYIWVTILLMEYILLTLLLSRLFQLLKETKKTFYSDVGVG